MKTAIFIFLQLALLSPSYNAYSSKKLEKEVIKEVVQEAINVAFIKGDIDLIKKYYHPGYTYITLEDNLLHYTPLYNLLEEVKRRKIKGEYPSKEKISIEFLSIEVAGHAATVKFDFSRQEKRTCADFVSLYRFREGWRIVSQTTYNYPES